MPKLKPRPRKRVGRRLVSCGELSKLTALTKNHLYNLAAKNRIPHFRLGAAIRFDLDAVLRTVRRGPR